MAKVINRATKISGESRLIADLSILVFNYDGSANIREAEGATVPVDATAGYAKGCLFSQTDGGVATTIYINEGSASSCDFNAIESSASTVTSVTAGNGMTGGGTEGAVTLDVVGGTGITANANDVQIAASYLPSHVVKFAATSPAYGGGGTSTAITVTGAAATDIATAVIRASTNAVSIVKAVLTTNTLTVHFSADPGADTTVDYSVLRAV